MADIDPLFLILASLAGLAALVTAIRETAKWLQERKVDETSKLLGQIETVTNRLERENERQSALIDKQRVEIDRLEEVNDKLERLCKELSGDHRDLQHQVTELIRELRSGHAAH